MNCKHCGKSIHWCVLAGKWFHDHNFMTFCTDAWGRAKAVPTDLLQPPSAQAARPA